MYKSLCVFALTAAFGASVAHADRLLIEAIDHEQMQSLDRPQRGSTMPQVLGRYGPPTQEVGPVGDPPISRWVYSDYTVVFEYDRVLHSVTHR
ncbi:hypothetical protein CAI21_21220 [Alkalilimnicola ehrlichii]|uniref:Phosphodiesterase n=1 Tax=Alkalilimnicola ehrlichii TaxID=351052 RepID=A0A3E0WP61_9GAMM|nr:hypothetical protein [Alkalilimnicola ehrlichii]RFA24558.1 hypothetical protein CAI21_21220 [Alkalilimnicola ehrlichii]RFA33776.1 hypothetical protein CAL65_16705 [Alkalilimnicola ehrlichii]